MLKILIPNEFQSDIFYQSEWIEWDESLDEKSLLTIPFIYDLTFYEGFNKEARPWENNNKYVPMLIEMWEEKIPLLTSLFEKRNRTAARPIMVSGTSSFMTSLFWSNEQPVPTLLHWENYVGDLNVKPVNTVERLSYILSSTDHYHSFIQISQLFEELKKQFYKEIALKNKK